MKNKILVAAVGFMLVHVCAYASVCTSGPLNSSSSLYAEYFASAEGPLAHNICEGCDSGVSLIAYTDAYGNSWAHYDCGSNPSNAGYGIKVKHSFTAPGCSGTTFEYWDCVAVSAGSTDYCDNDYYWDDNRNCIECPRPQENLYWLDDDNKTYLWNGSKSGDSCGYGTIDSSSEGVTSCVILKGLNGTNCVYCDTTGCFKLTADCAYSK